MVYICWRLYVDFFCTYLAAVNWFFLVCVLGGWIFNLSRK